VVYAFHEEHSLAHSLLAGQRQSEEAGVARYGAKSIQWRLAAPWRSPADFAKKAKPGDIVITNKNFGAGSSRQQAVDCFLALGISCIIAESYGAIYERNAINAAMPILTYDPGKLAEVELQNGDMIKVDFVTGELTNKRNGKTTSINRFYDAQLAIYKNGGLL